MGVTLDLRLIDHEHIAVRGLRAVNDAIRHQNPEILRTYLATLPVDVMPSLVECRERRLARLRELKLPDVIIENEVRLLRMTKGETYRPEAFATATFDELRHLLGTWCWSSNTYSLDKTWDELHWFLEPMAGPDEFPLLPHESARVGDPNLTAFTKALKGSVHYPKDDHGDPVIRTCGSAHEDCSGYNSPEACIEICEALSGIDASSWDAHVPFRFELYRHEYPSMEKGEIISRVQDDLESARDAFPSLLAAYTRAKELGWGVSCDYSL